MSLSFVAVLDGQENVKLFFLFFCIVLQTLLFVIL